MTEEEIAAGFEPWASGNELKTEKVCKRAYPVISEAIEPFSIGGVFEPTALTVSTIDKDKITPQLLEQLLCMDSVLNVRIVVKPIPLNPEGNVKQSTPNLFAKVAIALGIFIGAGLIIAAIILIVYNHKKRSKVNG